MTHPGRISVVIPCYNAAGYVGPTIRSALGQTRPPAEVVVVDDASSDDSAAVVAAFGPPVRLLRQPTNGGAAVARNAGVRAATGDWVAFLDADDVWAPDRLAKLGAAGAAAGPGAVGVFNDLYYLHPDGSTAPRPTPAGLLGPDFAVRLLCEWLVNPSALLVRGATARAVPFPAGVRNVEDQHYVILLRERGELVHVAEPLTGYRRRPGQLTADPRHALIAVRANLQFAAGRPDLYPPDALRRVRDWAGTALVSIHESAYWKREFGVVRECRRLYAEVAPGPAPPLFHARLLPRWLFRAKDWADRAVRGRPAVGTGR